MGVAWLNMFQPDAPLGRPVLNRATDVFRAVVTSNHLRLTPPSDDLLELPNDPLGRQGEVHLHSDGLAVEVIDDVEQPKRPAVFELVVHEVHRPYLIDTLWHGERLGLVAHKPLARLDPQIELQLFVDSVHALVIPFEAPDVAQIQVTQAKAPAAVVVGQTQQPVSHLDVLCVLRALIAVARLADAKRLAG